MHDGQTRRVEAPIPELTHRFLEKNQASITIIRGPSAGMEFSLERRRAIIGRSAEAEIQIDDPSISSEHAALELDNEGVGIRDLASTNGVQLNGAAVLASVLKHGDRIQIGECELQYVIEERSTPLKTWSVDE